MIVTTTETVEGKKVGRYLGLVHGETIYGMNIIKDFFASITDVIGGRAGVYEDGLRKARDNALSEMEGNAVKLGADGIIGLKYDAEVISFAQGGHMLIYTVTGTAVKLS